MNPIRNHSIAARDLGVAQCNSASDVLALIHARQKTPKPVTPVVRFGKPEPAPEPAPVIAPKIVWASSVHVQLNTELRETTFRRVMRECAEKHGVTIRDLRSIHRAAKFVHARQEAMYRLIVEYNFTYPQVGRQFGGRDHSTVHHGARAHAERSGLPMPAPRMIGGRPT